MKLTREQMRESLTTALTEKFGESTTLSRQQIMEVNEALGFTFPHWLINGDNRQARNMYAFPPATAQIAAAATSASPQQTAEIVVQMPVQRPETAPARTNLNVDNVGFTENLVPEKDDLYVPFGHYRDVENIIKSNMFYPTFITGLSGNGKTEMVLQACARKKREVIRVNFTVETDEDDLIGGFRLVAGETKFMKGPIISAMERGAIVLLDEIDLANPARIMCLQSIMEGKGYFIKKTGEFIRPAPGFQVIATANTKGKGSDDGRFIGTNVLNEAFLERFPITFEQQYPSPPIEKKILGRKFESLNLEDTDFINLLVDWADIIRKTFMDGGIDEVISTRRLVHIAQAYAIFGNRMKAVDMCINRFDEDTKVSFSDLYQKVDADAGKDETEDLSIAEDEFDELFGKNA